MTEAQWLACEGPGEMIDHLNERVHAKRKGRLVAMSALARRNRLFCCAACRLVWDSLTKEPARKAVEVAERFADGEASESERAEAEEAAEQLNDSVAFAAAFWAIWSDVRGNYTGGANYCYPLVVDALEFLTLKDRATRRRVRAKEKARAAALLRLSELLRDIFGNPFRPVTFSPSWRTDTALSLARQIYDSRDFSAMPILADALQDAGCDNEDILNHCRQVNGMHVRGCWVVDLVLDKE
jgi:hypothetical protein